MNVVSVDKVSKAIGDLTLFREISFGLTEGDRVALVGINGAGKSTLFELIAKIQMPDSGDIQIRKGLKVGFLPQQPHFETNETVADLIFKGNHPALPLLRTYEEWLLYGKPDSSNFESLTDLTLAIDAAEGWNLEAKIKETLGKFDIHDLNTKLETLSGGQQKRVCLAGILLQEPELLILDEPTNHLDIEAIEWMEKRFTKGQTTLFMISHDRYFIDAVCNRIIELDNGAIKTYKGNYAYFLEKKAEQLAIDQVTHDKAIQRYKKELEWMRRQPKARGTKSRAREDDFYQLENQVKNTKSNQTLVLDFKADRIGNKIIELHRISKSYGDKTLFEPFSYTFKKTDRIGIVGKNGTGKSTFLQLLTQNLAPDTGKVVIGETIKFGLYTQQPIQYVQEDKVIEHVSRIADVFELDNGSKINVSQFLTLFLFPPKKQQTLVRKLSGGEKRRLQLLSILIKKPNFLILDEPTNDLDMLTLQVLEQYLLAYKGCLIIVSHDRYFLDQLVDHLFVFDQHKITDFNGNYTDFRQEQSLNKKTEIAANLHSKPDNTPTNSYPKKAKLTFKEQKELENIEKTLPQKEKELAQILHLMNSGGAHETLTALSSQYSALEQEIELLTLQWLELTEKNN